MRVNRKFVEGKFREFNREIFLGRLPELPVEITGGRRQLGAFVYPVRRVRGRIVETGERNPKRCCLRMSACFDMPQKEIEDILIHEMIHYYIWWTRQTDTSQHGVIFRQLMNTVNRRFGRNVTVRSALSAEAHESDVKVKPHYIMVTRWRDGREGMTITARTRIFDLHRRFSALPEVESVEWYFSLDPFFNRFPAFQSMKYILLTDEIRQAISGATPLVNDGRTLRMK